jgi:hypothetical protein
VVEQKIQREGDDDCDRDRDGDAGNQHAVVEQPAEDVGNVEHRTSPEIVVESLRQMLGCRA